MRITSRGPAAATVGLVSAVVLAGCSSNSTKPTVLPSLPTTPAATTPAAVATSHAPAAAPTSASATSPTTAKPATSAALTKPADPLASANLAIRQAVTDYYKTLNRALQSSSAANEVVRKFSATCQQCSEDYKNVKQIHAKGWVVSGGQYNITKIVPQANDANSGAATITFTVAPITVRDSHGKLVANDKGQSQQSAGLTVDRSSKSWLIVGYIDFGKTS